MWLLKSIAGGFGFMILAFVPLYVAFVLWANRSKENSGFVAVSASALVVALILYFGSAFALGFWWMHRR